MWAGSLKSELYRNRLGRFARAGRGLMPLYAARASRSRTARTGASLRPQRARRPLRRAARQRHGVDTRKARHAGLLHDLARLYTPERLIAECEARGFAIEAAEREHPVLLHARLGRGDCAGTVRRYGRRGALRHRKTYDRRRRDVAAGLRRLSRRLARTRPALSRARRLSGSSLNAISRAQRKRRWSSRAGARNARLLKRRCAHRRADRRRPRERARQKG